MAPKNRPKSGAALRSAQPASSAALMSSMVAARTIGSGWRGRAAASFTSVMAGLPESMMARLR